MCIRDRYRSPCCLSSCTYAQEVMSKSGNVASPRWTTRAAFCHATSGPSRYDRVAIPDNVLTEKATATKPKIPKTRKCPCP